MSAKPSQVWLELVDEAATDDDIEFAPELPKVEPDDPTVTYTEFVARRDENQTEPLVTCEQGAVLTPGALAFLVGKTGGGKTTNALDFCLHAAAGVDFAAFAFPRPLRLLFVQNEGPREAFRAKLEERARHWHLDPDLVRVWDSAVGWGTVRISDQETRARMRRVVEQHQIDMIVSDSLTRFGVRGNGTPEETRDFIAWLTELGLGNDLAFLLLHHPLTRPDASLDELEQIAGEWAPHADVVMMLKKLGDNRARLSFPKPPRWARGTPQPQILGFDPATEMFTFLAFDTGDADERDYLAEITEFLAGRQQLEPKEAWRTAREIGASEEKGGIAAGRDRVEEVFENHPDRFTSRTGAAAKEVGRSPNATVWQLTESVDPASEPHEPHPLLGVGRSDSGSLAPPKEEPEAPSQTTPGFRGGSTAEPDRRSVNAGFDVEPELTPEQDAAVRALFDEDGNLRD
jgi:hypothetical protein